MDNKLIFENWRRFLVEKELKYSSTAALEMKQAVLRHSDNEKEKVTEFKIPQDEIYYSTNPKVKNGAVLYSLTSGENSSWNWDDLTDDEKNELASNWDTSSKSFDPKFAEQVLSKPIMMELVINNEDSNSMGSSHATITDGKLGFYISINPKNMSADKTSDLDETIEDTIRHELQHTTQKLNGLALNYGEQLDKANGDFSKIEIASTWDDIKKFGIGREKTGLRQAQGKEKQELDRSERTKRYLGDDFEYETWMSDIISQFIRFSVKQGLVTPQDIEEAKLGDILIGSIKWHQDRIQTAADDARRKKVRNHFLRSITTLAQQNGKSTQEVLKLAQGKTSSDQIATRLVRELIKGMDVSHPTPKDDDGNQMWKAGEALTTFGKNTTSYNVKAFQYLSKLRKKEFLGDFLANLTQRLKGQ
jgi:hypothetical protein